MTTRRNLFPTLQEIETSSDRMTARLREALSGKGPIKFNKRTWSQEISVLRRAIDDERINILISWLDDHLGDKYVPICKSARSFRMKFIQLEEAMQRGTKHHSPVIDQETRIQAKKICDELTLIWPNDEKKEELSFAELTLSFYKDFYSFLFKGRIPDDIDLGLLTRMKSEEKLRSWLSFIVLPPNCFLREWMRQRHRLSYDWKDWPKSLQGFHASLGSPHFNRVMLFHSRERYGDDATTKEVWQKLKGLMV